MQRSQNLIRDLLTTIKEDRQIREGENDTQAKFIDIMLNQLERFTSLYSTSQNKFIDHEAFLKLFGSVPSKLNQDDYENYVVFLHHLLKKGPLYGMAHEDPYAIITLVGSALKIFQQLVKEQVDRSDLLIGAIDLMVLQNLSIAAAGGDELAKIGLGQTLSLLYSKDEVEQEFDAKLSNEAFNAVQIRGALSAMSLATILDKNPSSKGQAIMIRSLAKSVLQTVLDTKEQIEANIDKLMATVSLAEIMAHEDNVRECETLLKSAMELTTQEIQDENKKDIPYLFLTSIVYRKLATVESSEKGDIESARTYFKLALDLAKQCAEAYRGNTHYLDHYGDVLNDVGIVYGIVGDFLSANEMFIQAIDNRRKLVELSEQYSVNLAASLTNMSILMKKFGHWQVAKYYLEEAIQLIEEQKADKASIATETTKSILRKMMEEIEAHCNPQNKLWVPITEDAYKYGAN